MRAVSILSAGVSAGAVLSAIGCGNGDDSLVPVPVAKVDGGGDAPSRVDATAGDDANGASADGGELDVAVHDAPEMDGEAAPTRTLALLRFANWSADSPEIDFCLAPHGTGAFRGPILGANAAVIDEAGIIDAGSGAVPFPEVSPYLVVDRGQYDVRLVAGGSVDCSAGILPDATSLPALVSGGLETIALVGAAQPQYRTEPGLQVVGFTDELQGRVAGALIVRVINAAVELPQVDVGTLMSVYLTPFFPQAVTFGDSSTGAMADPNGYSLQLPLTNVTVAARAAVPSVLDAAAHTIVATAPGITLPPGASVTFVVVGLHGLTDAGSTAQILECVDNSGMVGLQGSCQVVSR